jgi:hypothetical protein
MILLSPRTRCSYLHIEHLFRIMASLPLSGTEACAGLRCDFPRGKQCTATALSFLLQPQAFKSSSFDPNEIEHNTKQQLPHFSSAQLSNPPPNWKYRQPQNSIPLAPLDHSIVSTTRTDIWFEFPLDPGPSMVITPWDYHLRSKYDHNGIFLQLIGVLDHMRPGRLLPAHC